LATLESHRFERQTRIARRRYAASPRRSKQTVCGLLIYETTETNQTLPAQKGQQASAIESRTRRT
jgi:hypothetical protein